MNHTEVFDIAAYCHAAGITHAVISPGSRSALITLSFARYSHIKCTVVPDERSAAFVALGMSQNTGMCVALVCTSGSAALNYYPAVAEAYFNQVPLALFTADRPPEWIDQYDGQTIFQENVYGKHVKASLSLPVDTSSSESRQKFARLLKQGLALSLQSPEGPVHFNVPIREPFYTESLPEYSHSEIAPFEENYYEFKESTELIDKFYGIWGDSKNILIVAGQMERNSDVSQVLSEISNSDSVVLCQDIISNAQVEGGINHHDLFLSDLPETYRKKLTPDLLITFGRSVISKQLKEFIRSNKPIHHFHFENTETVHDPFQTVTQVFHANPFELLRGLPHNHQSSTYRSDWQRVEKLTSKLLDSRVHGFSELVATRFILSNLTTGDNLHLANSMPVRYANYINELSGVKVWSNRGVSGIDGCSSTAMGHALASPDQKHFLLTGDIAFFYDRNAFWQKALPQNLKIIVFNNGGGGIFRLIKGPSDLAELEEFFEYSHEKSARLVALEMGVSYSSADSPESLTYEWEKLAKSDGIHIMEILFDRIKTSENFKAFKVILKDNLAEL